MTVFDDAHGHRRQRFDWAVIRNTIGTNRVVRSTVTAVRWVFPKGNWQRKAIAALLGIVLAAIIGPKLQPDVRLSVSVTDPTLDELKALPRGENAAITATVVSEGRDSATDVKVMAGKTTCDAPTRIDDAADVMCAVDRADIPEDGGQLAVSASARHAATDETTVDVQWAARTCPLYPDVIAAGAPLGSGTIDDVGARWNAAVDSMGSAACDTPMDDFRMGAGTDRGEFPNGASYIIGLGGNRGLVDEVKITLPGDVVKDQAMVQRLMAAVAAKTSEQAERMEPSDMRSGPVTTEQTPTTTSRSDDNILVECGSRIPGVELVVVDATAASKQLSVRLCSN